MKIVLDNIIYSKERQGGISNVFYELTNYLLTKPDIDLKFIEEKTAELNGCRQNLAIAQEQIIQHKEKQNLFLARLLPVKAKIDGPFLYHSSYFRKLEGSRNFKEVTTIYDFVHTYYAGFLKKTIHNKLKYGAVKRANGIICISENTYKDLRRFCPPNRNQKVEVIHCGVSKSYMPLSSIEINNFEDQRVTELESGFLLFVGGRSNYKNFEFVVKLMNSLKGERLVVVGRPFTELELKDFEPDALERTTVLSGVSNEALNVLYNKAHVLLYPSDYEGFGIPVIEAMQASCPVIALNKSSIPEVAGDAGILLEITDISQFKDKIDLLKNTDFRTDIIGKGILQSQKFSWDKCNKETLEFYKEVY